MRESLAVAVIPRLENWARHFRDRPRQGKAGSAEGNYRSPSPDYSALLDLFPEFREHIEPMRARQAPPDARDAETLQDAITRLPERGRLVLSFWHIRRLPAPRIERMLRLPTRGFEATYLGTLRELEWQLERRMAA